MKKNTKINLISVTFSNHYSFEKKQKIFFERDTKYPQRDAWKLIKRGKKEILPVTVFYGANASGKSNLMLIFNKLRPFFKNSEKVSSRLQGFRPFRLNKIAPKSESFLEFELAVGNQVILYSLLFNASEILEEKLRLDETLLYEKNRTDIHLKDDKLSKFVKLELGDTLKRKKDVLVLELLAIKECQPYVDLYDIFQNSFTHFESVDKNTKLKEMLYADRKMCEKISQWLRSADIGISHFEVERRIVPDEKRKLQKEIFDKLKTIPELNISNEPDDGYGEQYEYDLKFYHRGENNQEYPFGVYVESRGTVVFLGMLVKLCSAFVEGGLFFMDEIDCSLHPLLVKVLIQAFNNPKINKGGAQLICTTHDINLLKKDVLRRDEIWFIEKDLSGHSIAYPLSQFNDVRNNVDYDKGYLEGRFGGIPLLGKLADFEKLMEG